MAASRSNPNKCKRARKCQKVIYSTLFRSLDLVCGVPIGECLIAPKSTDSKFRWGFTQRVRRSEMAYRGEVVCVYHLSDSFDTNYNNNNNKDEIYAMLCILYETFIFLLLGYLFFVFYIVKRSGLEEGYKCFLVWKMNFLHFAISMTNDFQMNVEIEFESD